MALNEEMNLINKPIIILGTGRSGTTLLSEVLFRHPALAFPSNYHEKFPEYPNIGIFRNLFDNPLYRLFGEKKQSINPVSFYNKLLFTPSEAWKMWDYLTLPTYSFSRGFLLNQSPEIDTIQKVTHYFNILIKSQFRERLAFKITGPSRIRFLHTIFPDAFYLFVKRNPVALIHSFLKVPFWQKQGMHKLWWEGAYSHEEVDLAESKSNDAIWMTCFQIKKILDVYEEEKKIVQGRIFEVNYEDFVNEPLIWLPQLLTMLDLEKNPACFEYFENHKIVKSNREDSSYFTKESLTLINSFFK